MEIESTNQFIKFLPEGLDLGLRNFPILFKLQTMAFTLLEL